MNNFYGILRPVVISEFCFGLLPHYNRAATKKKSGSTCFQYLSAKFALFRFWPHPITKLETDIQKWLWPELLAELKLNINIQNFNRLLDNLTSNTFNFSLLVCF